MSSHVDPFDRTVTVLGAGWPASLWRTSWRRSGIGSKSWKEVAGAADGFTPTVSGASPTPQSAELGAMRIPAAHRRTLDCVAEVGLSDALAPFHGLTPAGSAGVGVGNYSRKAAGMQTRLAELRADFLVADYPDDALLVAAELMALVDAVAPRPARAQLRCDLRQQLLRLLARVDLRPHHLPGTGVDLHRLFRAEPLLRQGCTGDLGSFLDDVLTETDETLLRIRGGMGRLVDRSLRATGQSGPHRPRGRRPAHRPPGGDHGGTAQRPHPDLAEPVRGVYIALPRRARVEAEGFGAEKLQVLREVRYASATKVALHCREPFWQADGMVEGAIGSGGILRQTYYPAVDGDARHGAVLLASYAVGEDADVLDQMPLHVRVASVLAELADIHPRAAPTRDGPRRCQRGLGAAPLDAGWLCRPVGQDRGRSGARSEAGWAAGAIAVLCWGAHLLHTCLD